ncbi:MAG: hypothetical protein KC561_15445 [Myxococcales bacterium]|nr:hypothetical protein [Myxococcales bacterium]
MTFRTRTLSLTLLLVGLIPLAAHADPPVPIDASMTDAATLRYQYTAGQVDAWRMQMVQNITMSGAGMPDNTTTESTMTMDTTQTVQSVDESGTATISQAISNTSVEMNVGGMEIPGDEVANMLNGLTVQMQITNRGEVLDTQMGEISDPMMAQMMGSLEDSFSQMTLTFPEEAIPVGHTWTEDLPMDMNQPGLDMDSSTTATYTFLGYANVEGTPMAVIESAITLTMSGDVSEMGASATVEGNGTGHGYTYFDNGSGTMHSGTVDMTVNVHLEGSGMTLDQAMDMQVSITKI